MEDNTQKFIPLFLEWADSFALFNATEKGKMLEAMMTYAITGEDTTFKNKVLNNAWRKIKKDLSVRSYNGR